MSKTTFSYDVFLSHSAKDKALVRDLAERLRQDDLRVWFDEWEIKAGDLIPKKIGGGTAKFPYPPAVHVPKCLCFRLGDFGAAYAFI